MTTLKADYLIIGAGVIGLTVARELKKRKPSARVLILEKEDRVAYHSSGRNSGVVHAGFYYSAESLKAKFCRAGNIAMKAYCNDHHIPILECGKLVVAKNEGEVKTLHELKRRGDVNGVPVSLVTTAEAEKIEPNVRTHEYALFSPSTASVDPKLVCSSLEKELRESGVEILFSEAFEKKISENEIQTSKQNLEFGTLINTAGLYADKVAQAFDIGHEYTLLPFKGIYIKWKGAGIPVRTHIYPVPSVKNPFLGVHFTLTADAHVKIGPTAIPAFWRENYNGFERFSAREMAEVLFHESRLWLNNSFDFRTLSFEEIKKYQMKVMAEQAALMVKEIDIGNFSEWSTPGIRAQLIHKKNLTLAPDFLTEFTKTSVHVLNAVSPAFTCSFSFAESLVEKMEGRGM